MCGITGAVGRPKSPILAHNLQTNLLRETKRRGRHATGFYAVGFDRKPMYDKAPISADQYVKRPEWKQLINGSIAMIGHARFTTNGAATVNGNNHPHVNKSGNMALVHNGIVYNYEEMKKDYTDTLESECDSELILRIISKEKDPLRGIKKVYELLGHGGDFACELIHLNQKTGKTTFYFFRDDGRPGKMIDARETLGQLIFCSESEIWKDAVHKSGMPRAVRQLSVHDIPEYQILSIDADTLKVKETKIEKPKYKSRCSKYANLTRNTTYYHGGNAYGSHYGVNHAYGYTDDDTYYTGYQYGGVKGNQQPTINHSSKYNTSVLGDGWIETVNPDTNLPRFVYDPDNAGGEDDTIDVDFVNKISNEISQTAEEEQDPAFRALLQQCVDDTNMRYPGWQDEAYSYHLITEDEWFKLSNDNESEDVMDHIDLNNLNIDEYDGDPIMSQQRIDDDVLADLALQQNVDGDEGFED